MDKKLTFQLRLLSHFLPKTGQNCRNSFYRPLVAGTATCTSTPASSTITSAWASLSISTESKCQSMKIQKKFKPMSKKKPKVVINDWNSFTLEPFYILLLAISGTWTDPTAVNANKKLYKCLNAICVRSHHQPNITVGQLCNVSLRSHGHVVRSWSQSYDREFQPQRC
jgi:hypothetical protein